MFDTIKKRVSMAVTSDHCTMTSVMIAKEVV